MYCPIRNEEDGTRKESVGLEIGSRYLAIVVSFNLKNRRLSKLGGIFRAV